MVEIIIIMPRRVNAAARACQDRVAKAEEMHRKQAGKQAARRRQASETGRQGGGWFRGYLTPTGYAAPPGGLMLGSCLLVY